MVDICQVSVGEKRNKTKRKLLFMILIVCDNNKIERGASFYVEKYTTV
jgi:hypothetical protein